MSNSLFGDSLPYTMSKSHVAFIMTCQKLFAEYRKLYFWTFTFKDVYSDWQYSGLWAGIIRDIANEFGGMCMGVRVVEAHKTHGLHYHAILTVRIPVEMVRRIGKRYGLGIIDVQRCDEGAAWYLSKYLTEDDTKLYSGMQRWHTVGGYVGVRKNDIEIDSIPLRAVRAFTQSMGKLDFRLAKVAYDYGMHYGEFRDWDYKTRMQFLTRVCAMAKKADGGVAWFNKAVEVVYGKQRILHDGQKRKEEWILDDNGMIEDVKGPVKWKPAFARPGIALEYVKKSEMDSQYCAGPF